MMIAYHPIYAHPLPEGHRFPMIKYELIPEQLLREGVITQAQTHTPEPIDEATILLTHDQNYWQRMRDLKLTDREMRAIGFPLSVELVLRERIITQGTIDCAFYALKHGVALNVAGGTHHAFADKGEGFCLLNDFAIAANYLLHNNLVQKVLIVDLDVHQGNGTAALFKNDSKVFTFSMHGAHNYPFHKEQSDLDVALPDGTNGATYLSLLQMHLTRLLTDVKPDIICYLCGVDVLETDRFGKLKLTQADCRKRDEIVFGKAHTAGLPVVAAMGGGYSADVRHIVNAHCETYKVAAEVYG